MFISEIAKKLKITTRTIRHYEETGIINSKRLENNYRYFDTDNIDKLIEILKPLGLVSTSRTGAVAMTRGSEIFK